MIDHVQLSGIASEIAVLQRLQAELRAEKRNIEEQISSKGRNVKGKVSDTVSHLNAVGSSAGSIDYLSSEFPWSSSVKAVMKKTFNIDHFRLCQEGVVNAALDDRDIVCVMPTGGGKSLTYQLPAIIGSKGLTVVISPLLALIWDQVRGLKSLGIECVVCRYTPSAS